MKNNEHNTDLIKSYYDTKIGVVEITEEDGFITGVSLCNDIGNNNLETELTRKAYKEITEYLDGKRKDFDLPIRLKGTDFQKSVWNALSKIPYGSTKTYKDTAIAVNNKNAARAIGSACHNNPVMIIIPCHRVIGADGSLTGFGGGIETKRFLLELEKGQKGSC